MDFSAFKRGKTAVTPTTPKPGCDLNFGEENGALESVI
jgi:hypothetical protein